MYASDSDGLGTKAPNVAYFVQIVMYFNASIDDARMLFYFEARALQLNISIIAHLNYQNTSSVSFYQSGKVARALTL